MKVSTAFMRDNDEMSRVNRACPWLIKFNTTPTTRLMIKALFTVDLLFAMRRLVIGEIFFRFFK